MQPTSAAECSRVLDAEVRPFEISGCSLRRAIYAIILPEQILWIALSITECAIVLEETLSTGPVILTVLTVDSCSCKNISMLGAVEDLIRS